jgi:hypothetical protein
MNETLPPLVVLILYDFCVSLLLIVFEIYNVINNNLSRTWVGRPEGACTVPNCTVLLGEGSCLCCGSPEYTLMPSDLRLR